MLRSAVRSTFAPSILRHSLRRPPSRLLFTRTTLARLALPHSPHAEAIAKPYKLADPRMKVGVAVLCTAGTRSFHATRRNDAFPVLPFLAGFLKASTALEIVRTAARIALTILPVILVKNYRVKRKLKWAEERGDTELVAKLQNHMLVQKNRNRLIFFHVLLAVPVLIFWAMILASLERTPLTGRWRLILLSPEEEEEISNQLAGPGWYRAVGDILSQDGTTPGVLPPTDWRFVWVRDTLRRLESVIPLLQHEREMDPAWVNCGPDDIPLPPPAEYPLKPRPRASEYVRRFAELSCGRAPPPVPHEIAGPPYSLIVVDKPDSSNAFSYGFGPDGGGGIVVFSGFLDDIMSKYPLRPDAAAAQPARSFWSSLFGTFGSVTHGSTHPTPTEEQTDELAILLAHELSHLILSHHLETLSSGSIIWPGVLSIGTDIVRALIFPITMMFGPFVNDALAGIGKVGSGEFTRLTEYCTSQKQEVEADVVSARLLAHAGFDPRHAVRFWEERQESERTAECTPTRASQRAANEKWEQETLPMRWMGSTHPMNVVRVESLKAELLRWERQRAEARKVLEQRAAEVQAEPANVADTE